MHQTLTLKPAQPRHAPAMARMSRDQIEQGLGWSWTPTRIAGQLQRLDGYGVLAIHQRQLAGFGLMRFGARRAHLLLLAVAPPHRRQGLGQRLLGWLEHLAQAMGNQEVTLELRATNQPARLFYQAQGYRAVARIPGYYQGREDALRMHRPLTHQR